MKTNRYLLGFALLVAGALPTLAQVSNDNEDGVNKVDQRHVQDFVPGQVLVKFKEENPMNVNNARGMFRSAGNSAVDAALKEFGVKKMDKLLPNAKSQESGNKSRSINRDVVEEKDLSQLYLVETDEAHASQTIQLVEKLKELDEVEYAEPNYLVYITADVPSGYGTMGTTKQQSFGRASVTSETTASVICSNPSSNPLYFRQYGITQQNIHKLWNKPIINKKRPVIAILDTGVDINHPDLAANIWTNTAEAEGESAYDDDGNGIVDDKYGWNFVDNYGDLTDRNGHGTHVAGIAAAADNNIGIVGANPLALIMPVKVMNDRGVGDQATIVRGIAYAVANGADVINMSFGSPILSSSLKEALDNAYQSGSVLVASAGNNGTDIYDVKDGGTQYPAAYCLVLGVEASASNLQRAIYSNYDPDGPIYSEDGIDGRNYEIQVPGDKIYSTLPDGKYNQLNGTSMSAPLFAGAVSALQMVKDYPSKDVLFGDLIHLQADFEKIYSDATPRMPKIDLVSVNIDDDVEGNTNIDGQVDVGETIRFYPVLRNSWADATDINLKLTVDPLYSNFVNIDNPEVSFGYSISAYGHQTAKTPIIVRFKDNIGDNTRIKFSLEVSYAENSESVNQEIYVDVHNMVKLSGLITDDRTLTANHVYYINQNIGIMEGATLTIEPGTRLEFAGGGITSFGRLVANGTPEKPIVFTGYKGAGWAGIVTHQPTGEHHYNGCVYTNEENNLFTLLPTKLTPNRFKDIRKDIYYGDGDDDPRREFHLVNYIQDFKEGMDMTSKQDLLTDPNYITPGMLQALSDLEDYCSQYSTTSSDATPYGTIANLHLPSWSIFDNPMDTISYCIIDGSSYNGSTPYMRNCYMKNIRTNAFSQNCPSGEKNTMVNCYFRGNYFGNINSNIVYCGFDTPPCYSLTDGFNNYFNHTTYNLLLYFHTSQPEIDKAKKPSYLGSSREDIIRPLIDEYGNGDSWGTIDLSNMPTRPYAEAHGIVWKVCVNGKDAQDEYEDLAPLGVGKHKFEVYFNRPMNKVVAPQISFGVREPYTQHSVNEYGENAGWNEEGTIFTAYKTISGKTMSDGVNRIYVWGAEDNEYFECPYEKTRFNINIQAAGSMATGFAGEGKMGRVELTWNNENNDFEDAMGFNIYRFGESYWKYSKDRYGNVTDSTLVADTICINKEIVDIETTEYTDYDVTPGTTYYYMYKVLSTDLQEYDISNVVAATPLTSTLGDANGSGDVDVADVITTVNHAAGMKPKPFIFEAADMNTDLQIDILDVIGIIQKILNPEAQSLSLMSEATATYTVEDGILFVESPVALGGVQVQLNMLEKKDINVTNDLDGFEHTSAWLTDNDYLFLAYNMNGKTLSAGKHALLTIGNADISDIRLSNTLGHNVNIEKGGSELTGVQAIGAKVFLQGGVFNMNGQKVTGKEADLKKLPNGVYIINGKKVVK